MTPPKIRFVVRDTSFRIISLQNEKERGVLSLFFLIEAYPAGKRQIPVSKSTPFFRSALFYCELNTTRCFQGQEGSSVKRRDRGVTMENIAVKGFN